MEKSCNSETLIPIVFITDNNFVMQTSVAITSLIANRGLARYKIFVIGAKLSNKNKKALKNMEKDGCIINIIDGDTEKFRNLHKYNVEGQGHYLSASEAALFKFDIPNLLPNYRKVIYLDGDTIILNSLNELYDTDLENNYVAAAHDTGKMYFKHKFVLECPDYFNSGVMLLNLELMRQNNVTEELIQTKLNLTDSNLMDQNVLNLVFKNKIKIVDIKYNLLVLNLERARGKWKVADINKLFNSNYVNFEDIKKQAYVIHFSSKDKPWKFSDVTFADEWFYYYKKSPFGSIKLNRDRKREKKIIVSMTSYPARINTVHLTIESLYKQTLAPDNIVLWLAPEQFPNKEKDLPKELIELTKVGLIIEWTPDIRSYKKLIPALKKYPEAIIVTVDDDVLYDNSCLELLYQTYLDQRAIVCHRGHYILFDKNKKILPYKQWEHRSEYNRPSYNVLQTGVGAVLYPPHCFYKDILNENLFMDLAYDADDLWFWSMALLQGTKICIAKNKISTMNYIDGTQETGLWHQNVDNLGNDEKLKRLINYYPILLRKLKKVYPDNSIFENIFSIKNEPVRKQHKIITVLGLKFKIRRKQKGEYSFLEKIFSLKNQESRGHKWYKVITILGLKFKFKTQELTQRKAIERIEKNLSIANKHIFSANNYIDSLEVKILQQQEILVKLQQENIKQQMVLNEYNSELSKMESFINSRILSEKKKIFSQVYKYLPVEIRSCALKDWYFEKTGEVLNLENPQTFNEKIQWLKLYDSTPKKTKLADKYLVRDWVKEKIGEEYLIPLLGVYNNFDEIDFDKLPNQFVIKCNHGCGYNIIVKDKLSFNKIDARKKINYWLNENFAFKEGFEMHYSDIQRKVIVEKYIENDNGDLYDYKFWCFNGKVQYIQFLSERHTNGLKMAFYDRDWNKQDFTYSYPLDVKTVNKPKNLDLMLELAEKLAQGFNHVRVDFYLLDDGDIKFGEMTFTSYSGVCSWKPQSTDLTFGNLLSLSKGDD